MSRITSSISEVEVLKPLKKPWTISLAQRWIREDLDQSKLIKKIFVKVKETTARLIFTLFYQSCTKYCEKYALVKITWRQQRRGKNSRPAKESSVTWKSSGNGS